MGDKRVTEDQDYRFSDVKAKSDPAMVSNVRMVWTSTAPVERFVECGEFFGGR